MAKTVVAIFDRHDYAENAARQIEEQGMRTADISIVAKQGEEQEYGAGTGRGDDGRTSMTMENRQRGVNDNISDGVVTGGILGGLAGILIGAGSMVVPGLGIVAAAGPITGLIAGTVTGGIVGGLVDLGIPENKSRQYETDIKAGKILFSMRAEDENVNRVASILRNNGAISVDSY